MLSPQSFYKDYWNLIVPINAFFSLLLQQIKAILSWHALLEFSYLHTVNHIHTYTTKSFDEPYVKIFNAMKSPNFYCAKMCRPFNITFTIFGSCTTFLGDCKLKVHHLLYNSHFSRWCIINPFLSLQTPTSNAYDLFSTITEIRISFKWTSQILLV